MEIPKKGEVSSMRHPDMTVANNVTIAVWMKSMRNRWDEVFPNIFRIPNSRPLFRKLPVWKWKKLRDAANNISRPTMETIKLMTVVMVAKFLSSFMVVAQAGHSWPIAENK